MPMPREPPIRRRRSVRATSTAAQPVGVRRRRRSRLGENDSAGQDDLARRFQAIRPPQFGEASRVDLARRGAATYCGADELGDRNRHRTRLAEWPM